ncbi:MAG TPA: HAMP domain-containing sensor histidine kinase, partial [Isosphaeraceae bacterium]|nr:HAMP domain-containing sensor histidine kinase [Isosphaeraceae bacterium]
WEPLDLRDPAGHPLAPDRRPLERALQGERFTEDEVILVRPGLPSRRLSCSGTAVRDAAGRIDLAIVTLRDVTALRQLERVKEEYVSLISHDLSNPLTIILGRAEILRRAAGRLGLEELAEHARAIVTSARHMNNLVRDLLEMSRLEAGKAEPRRVSFDLVTVARQVIAATVPPEEQGRIRIETIGPVPPVVADRGQIGRVIANLLANALRYSPAGTPVHVEVSARPTEVVLSIVDHGPGIAPDELPHLFEKYYRARLGRHEGGTGLGLYLSRLLIEASGGRIWISSTIGTGTMVSFALPRRRAT